MVAGILLAVVVGVTQASDVRTGVLFDGWYADPLIDRMRFAADGSIMPVKMTEAN